MVQIKYAVCEVTIVIYLFNSEYSKFCEFCSNPEKKNFSPFTFPYLWPEEIG